MKAPGVKELIGRPLVTDLPYSLFINIKNKDGYNLCGNNETMWAKYAGDSNYNILNECCIALNKKITGA
jgi:hypothetical protein